MCMLAVLTEAPCPNACSVQHERNLRTNLLLLTEGVIFYKLPNLNVGSRKVQVEKPMVHQPQPQHRQRPMRTSSFKSWLRHMHKVLPISPSPFNYECFSSVSYSSFAKAWISTIVCSFKNIDWNFTAVHIQSFNDKSMSSNLSHPSNCTCSLPVVRSPPNC